jgi:hypothetical protein
MCLIFSFLLAHAVTNVLEYHLLICQNVISQTAEPFVLEPSTSEAEVGKLKRYKSPGCDQIRAELI